MKLMSFAKRAAKEILRDPLTMLFGLGFPIVLLALLSLIQKNIPAPMFVIDRLAPGITIFGLSFISLFSATLISRDRESAYLMRLYTAPMSSSDFILGYMLPFLPIALMQTAVTYIAAIPFGFRPDVNTLISILLNLPASVLFTAIGLLCGSVLTQKQVGGICGAALTNLSAWLSGIWFDTALVGGAFQKAAELLPFSHAVNLSRAAAAGNYADIGTDLLWVCAYAAGVSVLAVLLFLRQMKKR